ncbi:MAG TPA: histidinol dehydrogenase [Pirellulales bacterium]
MPDNPLRIARLDARQADFGPALAELRLRLSPQGSVVSEAGRLRTIEVFGKPLSPQEVVERICGDVQSRGLAAVLEYCRKLDGAELTAETLRVPAEVLQQAHASAAPELLKTIRRIRGNIRAFQEAILEHDVRLPKANGGYLRQRYLPLERVGICIPGGAAAYPSTVLMTAVPAQVAGVRELAIVAPPTPFGAYNDALLATCHELGISEVYRVGGAQAVAALAYGVQGLRRVDKIVGPGNLFVALAKKHVYGTVDIDSIAGPSEVVVIADRTTPAAFAAADLLAQAEHSPGASIVIAWQEDVLAAIADELQRQLASLARAAQARESLEKFGALVLVAGPEQAAAVANGIAPEHLQIATEDAETMLKRIECAGAAFLGPYTPVALGDYVAGPSHVLPTGGTARFASGLCANDFLRRTSVMRFTREDMAEAAADVQFMADLEGLTAHRASIDVRLEADGP